MTAPTPGRKYSRRWRWSGRRQASRATTRRLRRNQKGPALAGRRLLLRRILQGFLARVHSVLRSLREWCVLQPEARLRSLCVARPPSEVGNPADVGLREIARSLAVTARRSGGGPSSRSRRANDLLGGEACRGRELDEQRLVGDQISEDAAIEPRGGGRPSLDARPKPGDGKKPFEPVAVRGQKGQNRDRQRFRRWSVDNPVFDGRRMRPILLSSTSRR